MENVDKDAERKANCGYAFDVAATARAEYSEKCIEDFKNEFMWSSHRFTPMCFEEPSATRPMVRPGHMEYFSGLPAARPPNYTTREREPELFSIKNPQKNPSGPICASSDRLA